QVVHVPRLAAVAVDRPVPRVGVDGRRGGGRRHRHGGAAGDHQRGDAGGDEARHPSTATRRCCDRWGFVEGRHDPPLSTGASGPPGAGAPRGELAHVRAAVLALTSTPVRVGVRPSFGPTKLACPVSTGAAALAYRL